MVVYPKFPKTSPHRLSHTLTLCGFYILYTKSLQKSNPPPPPPRCMCRNLKCIAQTFDFRALDILRDSAKKKKVVPPNGKTPIWCYFFHYFGCLFRFVELWHSTSLYIYIYIGDDKPGHLPTSNIVGGGGVSPTPELYTWHDIKQIPAWAEPLPRGVATGGLGGGHVPPTNSRCPPPTKKSCIHIF